jgi:hypothetical protein
MADKNLTRYLFRDGHEQVVGSKGKILAVRDPGSGIKEYLPMPGGMGTRYVKGSLCPFDERFSVEPQVGEQLITGSWFLGFSEYSSCTTIKQIDDNFRFPLGSE